MLFWSIIYKKGGVDLFSALFLSVLFSEAVLITSSRAGVFDAPDFTRKLNTVPVPRLGGVAFFLAFFSSLVLRAYISGAPLSHLDSALISGGGTSLLFGTLDDLRPKAPFPKLAMQLAAALLSAIILLYDATPLEIVLAVIYIIVLMNAYNLSDGIDGLCSGLSLSALLFLGALSLVFLNTGTAYTAILLFFSLLGFLPYNLERARMYMGDSGSQTLGLSLALISLSLGSGGIPLAPIFFALPLLDTALSIGRRLLSGRSPFSADREHIHHRLLDTGLSHSGVCSIMVLLSILLSILALISFLLL